MSTTFQPTAARRCAASLLFAGLVVAAPVQALDRVALARAYEHGEGVTRDQERAAELYCEAARDGDADAAFAFGWMLANGRGIPRNDAHAVAMFGWAARSGHVQAANMLELLRSAAPEFPDCLRPAVDPLAWGPPEPPVALDVGPPEPDPFADLPHWKRPVADLVARLAPGFGVDPKLALSVIAVESNFDAKAHSPKDARGLMQLIPKTAQRFDVKDPFDPRQNVRGGLAYLRFLLAYYRGDVGLAAAAYNAGEQAVDRFGGVPPYAETQAYVQKVLALYRRSWHPFDASHAPAASDVVLGLRLP